MDCTDATMDAGSKMEVETTSSSVPQTKPRSKKKKVIKRVNFGVPVGATNALHKEGAAPKSKGTTKRKLEEDDDAPAEVKPSLPTPEVTKQLMKRDKDQAERPAKRQRPEWIDPPEGTTLFQISMEKLHSKPVKGRRTLKQLDDMIEFGDPEETLREEKARIQAQKRWHQEIEKKKKEHRSSKKARMTAWLKSNQEAKKMQETRLGAD
jgi:hypothetical protein